MPFTRYPSYGHTHIRTQRGKQGLVLFQQPQHKGMTKNHS